MFAEIYQVFLDNGFEASKLHQVGMSANMGESMRQIQFNIRRLFPIVCTVLLVTIWLMFRRLWPVLITGTITILAVVWTMGFAVLLFKGISIFMSLIPGIVVIIAFSDVVQVQVLTALTGLGIEPQRHRVHSEFIFLIYGSTYFSVGSHTPIF